MRLEAPGAAQLSEFDQLDYTVPDPRIRICALMLLLVAERHLVAPEIAVMCASRGASATLVARDPPAYCERSAPASGRAI